MWAGSMVLAAKPKILGTMANQNGRRESTLLSCARASICVVWHTCAIHTTYILLSKSKGSLAPTHSPKPKYLQCNKCIFEEQWITWKFLRNNYVESTTKLNNYFSCVTTSPFWFYCVPLPGCKPQLQHLTAVLQYVQNQHYVVVKSVKHYPHKM